MNNLWLKWVCNPRTLLQIAAAKGSGTNEDRQRNKESLLLAAAFKPQLPGIYCLKCKGKNKVNIKGATRGSEDFQSIHKLKELKN